MAKSKLKVHKKVTTQAIKESDLDVFLKSAEDVKVLSETDEYTVYIMDTDSLTHEVITKALRSYYNTIKKSNNNG